MFYRHYKLLPSDCNFAKQKAVGLKKIWIQFSLKRILCNIQIEGKEALIEYMIYIGKNHS